MELYLFHRTSLLTPRETTNDFYRNNHHLPVFSRQSSSVELCSTFTGGVLQMHSSFKSGSKRIDNISWVSNLLGSPKDICVDDMGS